MPTGLHMVPDYYCVYYFGCLSSVGSKQVYYEQRVQKNYIFVMRMHATQSYSIEILINCGMFLVI